jgi:hypothetical protein
MFEFIKCERKYDANYEVHDGSMKEIDIDIIEILCRCIQIFHTNAVSKIKHNLIHNGGSMGTGILMERKRNTRFFISKLRVL